MATLRPALLGLACPALLCAQAGVPALDPAGLAQALKAGTWTVVEFGGPTCVPCRRMQPILAGLQQRFGARAQVRNFYVTEHLKEAREYRIMAMPTQVVFDPSGKEVARHVGFWESQDFLAGLAKAGLK
ncbi:MAG TPA: thioredoxin family protein [Holophaga sp.]|nr:thioredoxin family protein [Holophaga sp.]